MINFTEPYHSYNQDKKNLEKAITKVLKDGSYILGKNVKLFEKNFSRYLNIKYSVAVANGTDAIHLGLKALNIGKGDEVILPGNSFIATAWTIVNVGAKPVFVDVLDDYNIDPQIIKKEEKPINIEIKTDDEEINFQNREEKTEKIIDSSNQINKKRRKRFSL